MVGMGYVVSILMWLGALLWFVLSLGQGPESWFLRFAHYGAAVPMFGLIIVVVFVNGFNSTATLARIGRREVSYRPIYKGIAIAMGVGVVVGLVAWLTTRSNENPPPIVFWVEFGLLVLFGLFWGLQTWEFRRTGPPPRE